MEAILCSLSCRRPIAEYHIFDVYLFMTCKAVPLYVAAQCTYIIFTCNEVTKEKRRVLSLHNLQNYPLTKMEQWKSHERQYTLTNSTFIKSELPTELLPTSQATGKKVRLPWSRERLKNEAATLQYIASKTTIPVPKFLDLYEENGLLHLKTERVSGISLADMLSDTDTATATKHAAATKHVANCLRSFILPQLHELRNCTTGSIDPTLPLVPPVRITYQDERSTWSRKTSHTKDFVFYHNDLGQHNILIDPDTFEITAIIDWEYAGFYPDMFEYPLWRNHHKDQGEDHLQVAHLVEFLDTSNSPKAADVDTRTNYYKVRRTTQWASRDMGAEPVCLHFSRRMECPS